MTASARQFQTIALLCCGIAGLATSVPAAAETTIDRMRCKIDQLVDDFDVPFNQVQIQVKVDTTDPFTPIDIWVTHDEFGTVAPIHYGVLPVDGTATAEWDSSPDGTDPSVLYIDPGFVDANESITASVNVTGVATMSHTCRVKTSSMYRQDTKP